METEEMVRLALRALAKNPKTPEGWLWGLGNFPVELVQNPRTPKGLLEKLLMPSEGVRHLLREVKPHPYLLERAVEVLHPGLKGEHLLAALAHGVEKKDYRKAYAHPNLPEEALREALASPGEEPFFPWVLANPHFPLGEALEVAKEKAKAFRYDPIRLRKLLDVILHREDAEGLEVGDLKERKLLPQVDSALAHTLLKAPYTPKPLRVMAVGELIREGGEGLGNPTCFPLGKLREALRESGEGSARWVLKELDRPMEEVIGELTEALENIPLFEERLRYFFYRLGEDPLGEEARTALLREERLRALLFADPELDGDTLLLLLLDRNWEVRRTARDHPALEGILLETLPVEEG